MNKAYILFFILLVSLSAYSSGSQKDIVPDIVEKKLSLQKDIRLLEKDSALTAGRISTILTQIKADSARHIDLTADYESLTTASSRESIDSLRAEVDALRLKLLQLTEANDAMNNEIAAISERQKMAESELGDLNVYSEIEKQQIFNDNILYLQRKYSMMSAGRLAEMSKEANNFRTFKDFHDYKKRLDAAVSNKKAFDKAWECVTAGKDYPEANEMRGSINFLLDIEADNPEKGEFKLSPEQFNEIDTLDIRLSRYNSGIRELQNIVNRINSDETISGLRTSPSSKSECLKLMGQYILPEENTELAKINERYFKMIPYLGFLLRNYWEELNANPAGPTPTERTITELEVK